MVVEWSGDLTKDRSAEALKTLRSAFRREPDKTVVLSIDENARLDSFGVGLLEALREELTRSGRTLSIHTQSPSAREMLGIYEGEPPDAGNVAKPQGFFERTGAAVFGGFEQMLSFLILTSDTTALLLRSFVTRVYPMRSLVTQMIRLGSQSLPIVLLISFLVGLTTALQAAYQLLQFGANIYIADLVGVAMVAEMGPLMTAILVAGRCGSSIAAETATMVIAEEVDALKTMGIDPLGYVVLPRLLALVITQPLLTVLATVVGIGGGMLIGVLYLDVSLPAFWTELLTAVDVMDLVQALLKSLTFAVLIGLVAVHVGFRAKGGAPGVGRSTTSAVVASIFLVIVADAIYSLIFYFGD